MRDQLKNKNHKIKKEDDTHQKKEEKVNKEVIKEVVICKKNEDTEDLPRLPMTVSKRKESEKMLICSLLDTGTSTSILSHEMAKELKLKLQSGDHITLKTANGEEMNVQGITSIWLDMYEGKYERNKLSTRKKVDVIISDSLDGDEDILLSRKAMEKLILLPTNWPFHSEEPEIITSKLTKEEASEIIEDLQQGNISRCLKTSKKENKKEGEKEEQSMEDFIADRLYSTTGNIKDVPNMDQLPEEIQQLLR